ncbi:MAG: ABC transporter permease [Candidatus Tectomicrobia bacterium]|nr:ABC transporter permease [Candidatus Tectomicrobia bacterium]
MKLYQYILKRLVLLIGVLIGVSLMTFTISHMVPGDPVRAMAGMDASKEAIERIRQEYGLDKPAYQQYFIYMRNLLRGDLGMSIHTRRPVLDDIKDYLPATAELASVSLLLTILVGIPLGVFSAVRKDKLFDHCSRMVALIGVAAPSFWLALILQLIFYRLLGWLPYGGRINDAVDPPTAITQFYLIDSLLTWNIPAFASSLHHIILPAFVLSFSGLASIVRIQRASMLEVFGREYIKTARAKGLREWKVIYKHALKNAMIPVTTIIGLRFGGMLGGSFIVEWIFSWPGMGYYGTTSITALDFTAIMGVALILSVTYVIANLIVDILYTMLDPRISYG